MRAAAGIVLLSALLFGCGGSGEPATPVVPGVPPVPPDAEATEEVAADLFAAVERSPEDPAARRRLAIALHEARRRHEAVGHFEKLVELSPTRRHLIDLALAYGSIARIPEAVATYERVLTLSPEDPIVLHNLGNIYLRRGDNERAIAHYERAIRAKPDYLMAYYHLGDALARVERFKDAYRSYEKVLQLDPQDGQELLIADEALYRLGTLDLAMGAHERAAAFLAQVLEVNPAHPKAHHAYGQALMQLGRREEALRHFDEHMRLLAERDPSGPVATGD